MWGKNNYSKHYCDNDAESAIVSSIMVDGQ